MKILLTGILPASVWEMGERLARGGHHVSVLGSIVNLPTYKDRQLSVHDLYPGHPDALRIMEAARYQAVVFFYAFQCEDLHEYGSVQGSILDALFAMQSAARTNGVGHFILVTDRRVFGSEQAAREDETPVPDTPTGVLIKAAEDCLRCGAGDDLRTLLVRVTSLYAHGDPGSFFTHAIACAANSKELVLEGPENTPCDFLHADDLALFLETALVRRMTGIVHLFHGAPCTYAQVAGLLSQRLPGLRVSYSERCARRATLTGDAARKVDFVPRHDFTREIEALTAGTAGRRKRSFGIRQMLTSRLGKGLPWLEAAVLGAAAAALNHTAQTNATFRFADFWLLYVALMGNMHGSLLGVTAAAVACAAYAIEWMNGGNGLELLIYNMDHWLPLSCYLLTGAMFGYISDKHRERIEMLERESREQEQESAFLQTMYRQAYEDRNQLQEQVLRYRDSYGRIYAITRELDTMQPEQVFLSTLGVMEDTMQNHAVAIYSRKGNSDYARLVVHSRGMKRLARSINMNDFPQLKKALDEGKVFSNTGLEKGYPALAAPIRDEREAVAAVFLWEVPFDRQTLYFENLFNVVAGLVQSAMVRALHYFNMSGDMYLEDTQILNDSAFRAALGVYQNMRKRRTGTYLLVRVKSNEHLTLEEYDRRLARAKRSTDLAGRLSDGTYYVLFPQAGAENMGLISTRLQAQGLSCEVVSQEVAYV